MGFISRFFNSGGQAVRSLPRQIKFRCFVTDDPEITKKLYEWQKEHDENLAQILAFVKRKTSFMGVRYHDAQIKFDDNGRLKAICYNGIMPHGWRGVNGGHFMEPETPEAQIELNDLPCLPTRQAFHDIFNWPTFKASQIPYANEAMVTRINHLPCLTGQGHTSWLYLPEPSNFEDFPQIKAAVENWDMPAFLQPLPDVCAPRFTRKR